MIATVLQGKIATDDFDRDTIDSTVNNLDISYDAGTNGRYFDGTIDEIAIWKQIWPETKPRFHPYDPG